MKIGGDTMCFLIVYTAYFFFVMRHGTFPELSHYFIYAFGLSLIIGAIRGFNEGIEIKKAKKNYFIAIPVAGIASYLIYLFRERLIEIDNNIYLSNKEKHGVLVALVVDFLIPFIIPVIASLIHLLITWPLNSLAEKINKQNRNRKIKRVEQDLEDFSVKYSNKGNVSSADGLAYRELKSSLTVVPTHNYKDFSSDWNTSDEVAGTNDYLYNFLHYVQECECTKTTSEWTRITNDYYAEAYDIFIDLLSRTHDFVSVSGNNKVSSFLNTALSRLDSLSNDYQRTWKNYQEAIAAFEKDFPSITSGIIGEQIVYDALKTFDYELCILKGITLKLGEKTAENDLIVIAPQGIFSIEVKNRWKKDTLTLNIGRDGSWSEVYPDGSRHPIDNDPNGQSNWHLAILGQIIKENFGNRDISITGIIAIANNKAKIVNESLQKIVRPGEIINIIHSNIPKLNEIEMREIERVLRTYETPPKKYKMKNYYKSLKQGRLYLDVTVTRFYNQCHALLSFLDKWGL